MPFPDGLRDLGIVAGWVEPGAVLGDGRAVSAVVFCDYFVVGTDEAAVADATAVVPVADPNVDASGLDPFRQMALLERTLCGSLKGNRPQVLHADPASGQPAVIKVRPELARALSNASADQISETATSCHDELEGQVGGLEGWEFVDELAYLATLCRHVRGNLYCHVWQQGGSSWPDPKAWAA